MLANAWFPHRDFKLSFGSQDNIAQPLDALALGVEAPVVQFKDPDKTLLRQAIARLSSCRHPHVQCRLIVDHSAHESGVEKGRYSTW